MPRKRSGVYCLETIWFDEESNPSTRLVLELLKKLSDVPFVHRDVSTREELDFYLGRWIGRDTRKKDYRLADFRILYLGFHGAPGEISLRADQSHRFDDDEASLEKIAESFTRGKYGASDCVIHFSACSVLRSPARVRDFRQKVGAACVSGYRRSVDSTPAWAFELMYLNLLSDLLSDKNVNAGTLGTLREKITTKPEYAGLAETLGFAMIYE